VGNVNGVVRVLVVLAAGLLRAAHGPSACAQQTELVSAPRLQLVWIDVLGSAPYAFQKAARETSAILAGAGVEASWTLGDASTVTTGDELKIVLMPGNPIGARLPERVMGGTRRGAQSHTTWIYLSNVLWALDLKDSAARGLSAREEEQVARALGRVAAHEIVHAVAPGMPHSAHGLMSGTLGRAYLTQPTAALAPAERKLFRAAVEAFGPVTASAPVAVTVAAGGR